jgi:hypothetical protein
VAEPSERIQSGESVMYKYKTYRSRRYKIGEGEVFFEMLDTSNGCVYSIHYRSLKQSVLEAFDERINEFYGLPVTSLASKVAVLGCTFQQTLEPEMLIPLITLADKLERDSI